MADALYDVLSSIIAAAKPKLIRAMLRDEGKDQAIASVVNEMMAEASADIENEAEKRELAKMVSESVSAAADRLSEEDIDAFYLATPRQ
jgi:predicted dehydrogenase